MLEHLFFCCLVGVLNSNLFEFIVLSLSLSLNRNGNRNRKGAQTLELAQTQNNPAHPFPAAQSALSFSCLGPASWFPRTARAAQHSPSPLPHTRPDPARPAPRSAASKTRPASPRARATGPAALPPREQLGPAARRPPDPPVPPASVAAAPAPLTARPACQTFLPRSSPAERPAVISGETTGDFPPTASTIPGARL
jgi:hypothetical protein